MELIVRVVPAGHSARDVVVDLEPDHSVEELTRALCGQVDVPPAHACVTIARTGVRLGPADPIAACDLLSGDELYLGPPSRQVPVEPLPPRAVAADIIAGPESGRSLLLSPGRYRIGRGAEVDLAIDDPSVSRHHADVLVDETWSVTLVPVAGAANGVAVSDRATIEPVIVGSDDVVGLGGSRLAFRPFERSVGERIDRLGQIEFHRTPYRPATVTHCGDVTVGPIPERPEPRKLQILGMIAPLVAGMAMYAFSRQPQFLALTAVSPVVMMASAFEDRRSGRLRFRDQLRDFRTRIGEHRDRLEQLCHLERVGRLRAAPDLADLSRRAELRTVDLWARGRSSPDFLRLRLGLGAARVGYSIQLAPGGAADLRAELEAAIDGLDRIDNVPVTIDLVDDAVLGIHGERELVDGLAASLAIQAAALHSPEDLTIVGAVAPARSFAWLKWLPHVRSVASPLSGNHVVDTPESASAVVARLVEVCEFRSQGARGDDVTRCWPRLLVVLDADLGPDPVEVSRLLDAGREAGVSVVWLAGSLANVPRQASQVLGVRRGDGAAMVGRLWSTDTHVADRDLEVEHLRGPRAERVARALAPLRDASTASQATSIPRTAPLLDVLGVGCPSPGWVSAQWLSATGYHLRFPIGFDAAGRLEIDLVEDGPHTLIGGTSGAGKSELLQSMVAALAVRHPPTRLNFLFVDYKGGASSNMFERLPHTVGYVTNLDAALSLRALTSLRAELEHRMRSMEGRAKDLAEMLRTAPNDAPPSLVIVVDEFATLVNEVPDFVAGIVDIAQRGRSLGIHLVLATQRPSGSVNENILANTNLRIALRMLDRSDSTSIIDSPEAADVPVPLKGRGFVRLGPRHLVEFQSAYAGAPLVAGDQRQTVKVADYANTDDSPRSAWPAVTGSASDEPATQLTAVIDAIAQANAQLALPTPRRPWRDVLPEVVTLHMVGSGPDAEHVTAQPGRVVTVGLLDAPECQEQRPAVIDLEEGGGCLVFGSGGSGKTTLLRTVATSISVSSAGGDVAIVGFDFASRGLSNIKPLPEVVDVATGDDLESVTRHLTLLDHELVRRRALLAEVGAEHLTAYNSLRPPLPRLVVLIDGFGVMASTFVNAGGSVAGASMEMWGELIQRLVVEGRQVGIHTVLTADRHNAVPARIHSSVACRIVLRHADVSAYADHGIPGERARRLDLPPGRGLLHGTTLVQLAAVSNDPAAKAQGDRIASVADRLGRQRTDVLASARLPCSIALDQIDKPRERRLRPCIGINDVRGEPVLVDLEWSNLTVCGGARSGRSTALATVARTMGQAHEVYVVAPASSPLGRLDLGVPAERVITGRADEIARGVDRLANLAEMGPGARSRVLIIDDVDRLDDFALTTSWERIVRFDELRVVASMESRSMSGYTQSPLVNVLRRSQRLLVLRPDDPADFLAATGVRLPIRPGTELPPGRGVLLVDRVPTVLQVATPS